MSNEPIYADRDIGNTTVQTAYLVETLLGAGRLGMMSSNDVVTLSSRYMAAKMLADHPTFENSDFEPETVVRAIRDAINAHNALDRTPEAEQTLEQMDTAGSASEIAHELCRQMARMIVEA